jgi:hypothetical protein
MSVTLGNASKFLGMLGTVAGILGGVAAIAPFLQPKPTAQMWIEKAQLYGIPALDSRPNSVKGAPDDFGSVTVAIRNNSPNLIQKPTLQFQNLRDFKGAVVAEGNMAKSAAEKLEEGWSQEIVSYPNDTTIGLPDLNPGAGITVQAFGSNWKYVDPQFTGVPDSRKTWIITVADSRVHKYLFEDHLWILNLAIFIAGCILLMTSRPPKPQPDPHP